MTSARTRLAERIALEAERFGMPAAASPACWTQSSVLDPLIELAGACIAEQVRREWPVDEPQEPFVMDGPE